MVKIIHIFFCAVVILISSGDQQNLKMQVMFEVFPVLTVCTG